MTESKRIFYRPVDVWHRKDPEALVRYRCFEVIPLGKFCVQSRDTYRPPFTGETATALERQLLELLAEESPDLRSGLHDSVEEAIRSHDEDFGE